MTYFEWVEYFQKLKESPMDDSLLENVVGKKLDGGEYVLNRYIDHVIQVVNTRLNNSFNYCLDKMYTSDMDINMLSLNLINFKKEKVYLNKIVDLPVIGEEIKETFVNTIDNVFNDMCNILRRNIEYIDVNGECSSVFNKIMIGSVEE